MRRRAFLSLPALALATRTRAASKPRTLTVAAHLHAPAREPVLETRFGVFDPIYLASASWGGRILCSALYDGLYVRTAHGTVRPGLAASAQRSDDATVWHLRLAVPPREGRWRRHPDAVAVARRLQQVFAASEAIFATKDVSKRVRSTIGAYGRWITSISAFDAETVEIRGRAPMPLLPYALGEPALRIPLSDPTRTEAQPGDGPMALAELPREYRAQGKGFVPLGTYFNLIPRQGPLRREAARAIELVALPGGIRRTAALRRGSAHIAVNVQDAPVPEGARVITHDGEIGLALLFDPEVMREDAGATANALRRWLWHRKVLHRRSVHGARRGRNLPMRRSRCREPGREDSQAREVLRAAAPKHSVRCAAHAGHRKVGKSIAEALGEVGWDVSVVRHSEEAELVLHAVAENPDPRIALSSLLQHPRNAGGRGVEIASRSGQQAAQRMYGATSPQDALRYACDLARWVETRHPWAMLGWPLQASAMVPGMRTGRTATLRPGSLDHVVDEWTPT